MSEITHEQIAKRAYVIYLRNGAQNGRDRQNWLQAEAELKAESTKVVEPARVVTSAAASVANVARKAASAVGLMTTKSAGRGRKSSSRIKLN